MMAAGEVIEASRARPERLEALRARRLAALLEAARGSPLYRGLLGDRPASQWRLQDLPALSKAALMLRFDEWVTDPRLRLQDLRRFLADPTRIGDAYLDRYQVWESSGSTGEPAIFVNDAASLAVYDALETLRRPTTRPWSRVFDPLFLGERFAFVGATSGHFAGTTTMERLRRLNPLAAPHLRSLSFLQPVGQLAAELDAFQPTILSTYPSTAVILGEEQLAGRLHIHPREVWTGGETLTPAMRAFAARAFGCAVGNDYGCSEFLSLATECSHGRLHANTDWAILEPVDEAGRPLPAGTAGPRCLLTNLANHVQPLIRFDLGDRVQLATEPCPCGSALPVIHVLGRSDDSLRLGTARRPVHLSPLALCTVLEDDAGLFDFQLVQLGPRRLDLTTRPDTGRTAEDLDRGRSALLAFMAGQGLRGVAVECHQREPIRQRASGKIKRVLAAARDPA